MTNDFDEIFFESINDTLADVLGAACRDVIFSHLLTQFSIPKEQLPTHLDVLTEDLENIFGEAQTEAISRVIAKRLYSKLHVDFADHADFNLQRYVNKAKRNKAPKSDRRSSS